MTNGIRDARTQGERRAQRHRDARLLLGYVIIATVVLFVVAARVFAAVGSALA